MASPCRAKVRTNWCSFIAACTLSDCAYAALFSVTFVLKQLLVFPRAPLPLPPPDLDNLRAASVNFNVALSVDIGQVGVDMFISTTIDPAPV